MLIKIMIFISYRYVFWWMKNILFEICFFSPLFIQIRLGSLFSFLYQKKRGEFLLLIHRMHGELRGGIDL